MPKNEKADADPVKDEHAQVKKRSRNKYLKIALIGILVLASVILAYGSYIYFMSPAVIRNPKLEHYHFRMQILVNGKAENFAEQKYQVGYSKDQCNASLPEQPIHFHDEVDQFTHIHWEGMTGGMVMKYYGWNFIGGIREALGFKLDNLADIQKVNTHGDYLPAIPSDSKFYIYVGDSSSYKEKSFEDWKNLDLEKFFETESNFPAHKQNQQTSLINKLFPKVSAHGTADDEDGDDGPETEQQRLTRINNLVGNVVIFVQKDKPTDEQIKDRFNQLIPLTDSTCGG